MTAHSTSSLSDTPMLGVLIDREVEILHAILSNASFAGAPELLDQVRMAQAAPMSDATCRVYVLHLDAPRSSFSPDERVKIPGRYPVRSPEGTELGEIAIWVDHGHLRALQYISLSERTPMTLPPAEWIHVRMPVPGAVRARGAAQAIAGVRAFTSLPVVAPTKDGAAPTPARSRWARILATVAFAACVAALVVFAFTQGRASGADLAGARAAGERAGAKQGAVEGSLEGAFRASTEGALAGRGSSYQPAFDTAFAAARLDARRTALASRRRALTQAAAAATAAPARSGDVTSCSGFRDARGYWICSG